MRISRLVFLVLLGAALVTPMTVDAQPRVPLYLGTYTDGTSKGVYRAEFDITTGRLSDPALVATLASPSFLAWHPTRDVLFAVSETDAGSVVAYAVKADGSLSKINEQPSGGGAPCYVSVNASGTHVLVANYTGGSVSSFAIRADGGLEAVSVVQHHGASVTARQKGPHAHSITPAPGGRFLVAADLGTDHLPVYALDPQGRLVAHSAPEAAVARGAGPRHVAFDPAGATMYAMNELNSTVTTYTWDGVRGALLAKGTVSTLPAGVMVANTTAHVAVHPSGRFVFGSNRGHDSIAVFRVAADKTLTLASTTPTGGKTPRNFAIDPSGNYLLVGNQQSDTITVFRIDLDSGALTPTRQSVSIGAPVCIRFRPER